MISDSVNQVNSDEFADRGLAESWRTGDLPTSIQILMDGPDNSSDEGRQILEVIHDIAPDASLAFHSGAFGPHQMANAIEDLARSANAKVIIDDVRYPNEPFFNDGLLAKTVDEVANTHDVSYVTAAGNFGDRGWQSAFHGSEQNVAGETGTFAIVGGTNQASDFLQNFDLEEGQSLDMVLQWDSAFIEGGSNFNTFQVKNQIDVLVTDREGKHVFARFDDVTANTDEALQRVVFKNTGEYGSNQFALAYRLSSGQAPDRLKWIRFDDHSAMEYQGASTVFGHAASLDAFAIAAVGAESTSQARDYSSRGGVEILFDSNGNRLEKPLFRQKPDVAAPDGISVSYGVGASTVFAGTSAAAAHVAGNAALMRQRLGDSSYYATTHNLITKAEDLGVKGWDGATGYGLDPAGAPPTSIPLNGTFWTMVGPAPITDAQVPGSGVASGRLTGIAAHPTNANIIYVASAGGGVWRTVNGGRNWSPLTDNQASLFMGSIAISRSNPSVLYAGTGEATNSATSFYGRGILKSTNGGTSWSLLTNSGAFDRKTVSSIAVAGNNPNIVFATVSGNGANGTAGGGGLFKSTNGGATWTNVSSGIPNVNGAETFTSVVVNPTNSNIVYLAIGTDFNGDAANGVYVSTDGGTNWSAGDFPLGGNNGTIELALARSNPSIVFAAVTDRTSGGILNIFRTANAGVNWTATTLPPNYLGTQGWYASAIGVSPTNPDLVFVGGLDVLLSSDAGQSWTNTNAGANGNGPHVDHHAMTFDASNRLLDGNDGGIWRLNNSTVGSINWGNLNGNLATAQFIGGDVHPTNPNIAYGGTQDNGTLKFTGNRGWEVILGGDGGFSRVDYRTPNIVYATTQRSGQESTFLNRSSDSGGTFANITAGINTQDNSEFYVPYVLDPSNPSRIVLGTDRLYVSTNRGNAWAAISTPNTGGWDTGSVVTSIAVAKTAGQTIYAATANGNLFVTTNNGTTWTNRSVPGVSSPIRSILVDPTNARVAYVTIERFGGGKVYRTVNGGANWVDITGNLPNVPAFALAFNSSSRSLFVGNDLGVWGAGATGGSWSRFGAGMPNVQVRELNFNPRLNILTAFTHGRSVWQIKPGGGPPPGPFNPVTSDNNNTSDKASNLGFVSQGSSVLSGLKIG
ncbi:MAG: S8 family serine peptidase, partial [Gemmataceae bacterium]